VFPGARRPCRRRPGEHAQRIAVDAHGKLGAHGCGAGALGAGQRGHDVLGQHPRDVHALPPGRGKLVIGIELRLRRKGKEHERDEYGAKA
jgi:hypothetical protein